MKSSGALVAGVIMLASGCTMNTHATVQATTRPMPAGCANALANLPSSLPTTAKEASADTDRLAGHEGGRLASLINQVAADTATLGFDLGSAGSVPADVQKYQQDVAALRSFCRSGHK